MVKEKSCAVEVNNLNKSFKNKKVLCEISFKVSRGEIFGIIGPNGAGKTVLLNTILGLISPDKGEIKIFNKKVFKNLREIRRRINFASSYSQLPPDLDIVSNLKVFAMLYGIKKPLEKINHLIDFFDLKELVDSKRLLRYFSSGENARVSLAKSLLNDPEIILLDEATASLDNRLAKKTINLLKKMNKERGLTIIYTTHRLEELKYFKGTVCCLEAGVIKSIKKP